MGSTAPQIETLGKSLPRAYPNNPAGFFSRAVAFIIDLVILSVAQLVGAALIQTLLKFFRLTGLVENIKTILESSAFQIGSGAVLLTLLVIGYYTFFWTLVGFTPGKAILGLKVVRSNGKKLSFGRSLVRFISYWISAIPLFLGFFWVLWDSKRQSWHDKIAGSQVVYIPKNPHK
jgi:uncharacterized RDD family membrane protein YckC